MAHKDGCVATELAVVIVAYNSRDLLPACIERVSGIADVLVVDHGTDGSADVASALGARVISDRSNPGYGTGQNRGAAQSESEYLLLLNPDALVSAAGLSEGLEYLRSAPDVGAVQGVIRNLTTRHPERSQGVALGPLHLFGRALGARRLLRFNLIRRLVPGDSVLADHVNRVPDAPTEVESLAATALLMRRSAFESVGGFDEGFFLYSEDLDLCRRLRFAGWRLMALPVEWAEHVSGASSAGWWNREIVWWEGTLRYAAKWWSPSDWRAAKVATLLRIIPMMVRRPGRSKEVVSRLILTPRAVRRTPIKLER